MAKNNSSNQDFTNNADGFDISGGTAKRKLTTTGADITLTGSGVNTYTFPSGSDVLAGLAAVQTITGAWSYNDGKLILNGVTSGNTTLKSGAIAGTSVITLPVATDTLVGKATTDTFTNKRVTPRVGTTTSSATPTINTDNVDAYSITALAVAITSMTTSLSGTPTDFQRLTIRIKDDGTARAIAWGASFASRGVTLPTTTVISKVLTVGFIYNSVTSTWDCVASAQEA